MLKADPKAEDCIEMLGRLVAHDTTSRLSNLALIEDVRAMLDEIGVESRLTYNAQKTKANLWATMGPQERGGIVLSGHTDVVPVDGQDWASDPFAMEEREGKLFGRGTADMKGFVACALAQAKRMKDAPLKTPIHFAFSYDEEVGCTGVKELIADVSDHLPQPLAVIVGEPTMMQIVGGHKGGLSYNTIVRGVDGHSSAPDLGANAIFAAARIIAEIERLAQRLKEEGDPDNGFSPYYTTVDLGLISGGTAANIIPAECKFTWGFRNVPGDDPAAFAQEIMDYAAREIEPALKAVSSSAGIFHEERHNLPAMIPDEQSSAETLLRHLTGLNHSGRVAYGTEAARFQKAGMPGVIFGPGSITQAHLPDEFIAVDQMRQCHDFMGDLIDWACREESIA